MKTSIKTTATGSVFICYDSMDGKRKERLFFCPSDGGYIRESMDNGGARQVCEHLADTGRTLSVSRRELLESVIRREYKAMRAAEKREMHA